MVETTDKTACGFEISELALTQIGYLLGVEMTVHAISAHDGQGCKAAAAHLTAFVAHMLKLKPEDLPMVIAELNRHAKVCHCGDGR